MSSNSIRAGLAGNSQQHGTQSTNPNGGSAQIQSYSDTGAEVDTLHQLIQALLSRDITDYNIAKGLRDSDRHGEV